MLSAVNVASDRLFPGLEAELGKELPPSHMKRMSEDEKKPHAAPVPEPALPPKKPQPKGSAADEIGGPKGPEPTRYGDWEQNGRCTDF